MQLKQIAAAIGLFTTASGVYASETVTYTYDAKGRLTNVAHAGGLNDGATTNYQLDAADNRISVTATGYRSGVVVVPLNGMTVIPLS